MVKKIEIKKSLEYLKSDFPENIVLTKKLPKKYQKICKEKRSTIRFVRKKISNFEQFILKDHQVSNLENNFKVLFSLEQFKNEILKRQIQHKKFSEFLLRLKEKKKFSLIYGNISKKFFEKSLNKAKRSLGKNSENLLIQYETRLDVLLYRINFCKNIKIGRQYIAHNLIKVNNNIVNIPSYQLKAGDVISVDKSKLNFIANQILQLVKKITTKRRFRSLISYKILQRFFFIGVLQDKHRALINKVDQQQVVGVLCNKTKPAGSTTTVQAKRSTKSQAMYDSLYKVKDKKKILIERSFFKNFNQQSIKVNATVQTKRSTNNSSLMDNSVNHTIFDFLINKIDEHNQSTFLINPINKVHQSLYNQFFIFDKLSYYYKNIAVDFQSKNYKNLKKLNIVFFFRTKQRTVQANRSTKDNITKKSTKQQGLYKLSHHIVVGSEVLYELNQIRFRSNKIRKELKESKKKNIIETISKINMIHTLLRSCKNSTVLSFSPNIFEIPFEFTKYNYFGSSIDSKFKLSINEKLEILNNRLKSLNLNQTSIKDYINLKIKRILRRKRSRQSSLSAYRVSPMKPLHVEISFKLLKAVILYPPQKIVFPALLNMDHLLRSFNR